MAEHQKPEIKVLGDAGELIMGSKPPVINEPDGEALQAATDFETD